MIRRFLGRLTQPRAPRASPAELLRGIPKVRRLKNYQAESGFTWSYYYEGYRVLDAPEAARAHVFTLLAGGHASLELTIVIRETILAEIRARGARDLFAGNPRTRQDASFLDPRS